MVDELREPQGREPFESIAQSFRSESQQQVRVEQHVTIRITPRPPIMQRNMLADLPGEAIGPRFIERRMGRCLTISAIAGVQPSGSNKLILFMRDQRIVSASLEKTCRSRDFYSGFYVERSDDGQICVDREQLRSRTGANCQLTGLKQLIEVDE